MSRILLIAAIVLTIAAAALGFLTKGKIVGIKGERDTARAQLASTKIQLRETTDKLNASQAELASTKTTLEGKERDLTETKGKLQTAENDARQVRETLTAKETELATSKAKLDEVMVKIGNAPGGDINALTKQMEDLKKDADEKKIALETATSRIKNLEGTEADLKNKIAKYELKVMQPGIEGTVMAVNQGWNFIVIDIGDKKGVAMNAEMIVKRDGSRIATVKITSVEPHTAVADIVPGTLARGYKVQAGDKVIFEKGS